MYVNYMWSCMNCSLWMHQTFHISIYLLENSILDFHYFGFYKSCGFGPFSISRSWFIMYNKKVIKQHHPLFLLVKLCSAHNSKFSIPPSKLIYMPKFYWLHGFQRAPSHFQYPKSYLDLWPTETDRTAGQVLMNPCVLLRYPHWLQGVVVSPHLV